MRLATSPLLLSGIFALAIGVPSKGADSLAYHATYEIGIESTMFTATFDWSEFDHSGWGFDRGFYTDRHLTDYCFARILSPKWAVIVRLPRSVINNPAPVPELLLITRDDTMLIRSYKNPEPRKVIDGVLTLHSFTMTTEAGKRVEGKMSAQERRLIREIDTSKYGTLYGNGYERAQWCQSPELLRQLDGLREATLLGHPAPHSQTNAHSFHGFHEFTSRFILGNQKGNMKPVRIFFSYTDKIWTESPTKVAVYKRGQFLGPFQKFATFSVINKGLKFNLDGNSLYFDPDTGRLTFLVPRPLDSLIEWVFENP